jgi:hypothetical protein
MDRAMPNDPAVWAAAIALAGNLLGVLGVWKRLGDLQQRIEALDGKLDQKADKDDVADLRSRVLAIEDTCRQRGCRVSA